MAPKACSLSQTFRTPSRKFSKSMVDRSDFSNRLVGWDGMEDSNGMGWDGMIFGLDG